MKTEKIKDLFFDALGVSIRLVGQKATPSLLARSRDFERLERAPRCLAGIHTCAVVCTRPPCVPRSRECETGPAAARTGHANVQKSAFGTFLVLLQTTRSYTPKYTDSPQDGRHQYRVPVPPPYYSYRRLCDNPCHRYLVLYVVYLVRQVQSVSTRYLLYASTSIILRSM